MSTRSSRGHTEEIIAKSNNTAAEGADGFRNFLQIIDELERVRAERGLMLRSSDEASGEQVVFEDYIP